MSGSGEEGTSISRKGKEKKQYHRHSTEQIQRLEAVYKENPHPDENQRQQLSKDIGLDPKQIKFWFQNKRTQTKTQNGKADNSAFRSENEKLRFENLAMQETLKTVICPTCDGSILGEDGRQLNLQRLRMENARLKAEYEQTLAYISNCMETSTMPPSVIEPSSSIARNHFLNEGIGITPPLHPLTSENPTSPNQLSGIQEIDKSIIIETAIAAMDELLELFRLKEPVWIKSPIEGRYLLHRESYDKLFPKPYHFKTSSARIESSRYSSEVAMAAMHLIEMFLDLNKWKDMFPTIITKAKTIGMIDTGNLGGSLHLIYEKMHILSPLVAPREFFFIRYCRQLNSCTWVVVDVSYDFIKELQDAVPTRSWRLPSGCMIENMSNGNSSVTWIEHVQVDDKSLTHRLYRDLVFACQAYGAKRWIVALQRNCERFAFSMGISTSSTNKLEGVIDSPDGRRNLMKLSHRMVKNFCEVLGMSDKLNFSQMSEMNNSGVRVALRKSSGLGQPEGLIVCAATSTWLPISHENLFNFLKDEKMKAQWDILSNGAAANAIAHISTGTHPGNCISIIQPFVTTESNMLVLQECTIDQLGSMMIYAPIDLPAISKVVGGEDTARVSILPSGYIISSDGRPEKVTGASSSSATSQPHGSLLTVAFQVLVCRHTPSKQLHMESVANVHSLISSTIQKIKVALECAEIE